MVEITHRLRGSKERAVDLIDVGKLVLIVLAPTLIGGIAVSAPKWMGAIARAWPERGSRDPKPLGPPIEQLAVDLRRLLRLHAELSASAHLAMRAHRLWAVEAAIGVRVIEAADALDVPHREPERPGALTRDELSGLLYALVDACLLLTSNFGTFIRVGRF
jgi:integrase